MQYSHHYENDVLIIEIDEEKEPFCEIETEDLVKELLAFPIKGKNRIVFDFMKKKHLNSTELGILIKLHEKLFESGLEISIAHPSKQILDLLAMVGLSDFFIIEKS
ncbi:MAG: STAS domain-containing protein [Spirochaetes bacterium]|nr:STAS domain-containing protein [Spirochaetota bacterium]